MGVLTKLAQQDFCQLRTKPTVEAESKRELRGNWFKFRQRIIVTPWDGDGSSPRGWREMIGGHLSMARVTSLVVQRFKLWVSNAGDPGSIPGQGTRSHMQQLRVHMLQPRPGAITSWALMEKWVKAYSYTFPDTTQPKTSWKKLTLRSKIWGAASSGVLCISTAVRNSEVRLYSIRNYIQSPGINPSGQEYFKKNLCMHKTESPSCTTEIGTTLQTNYTSIIIIKNNNSPLAT